MATKKSDGQLIAERMMFLSGLIKEGTEEDIKDKMSSKLDKNFRGAAAGKDVEMTHLDANTELEDDELLDADFEDENLGDAVWSDDEDLSDVVDEPAVNPVGASFEAEDEHQWGRAPKDWDPEGEDILLPGEETEYEHGMTDFEETPLEDLDEPNAADDWMLQNRQNAQSQANKFKFEGKKDRTVRITESQLRKVIKALLGEQLTKKTINQ